MNWYRDITKNSRKYGIKCHPWRILGLLILSLFLLEAVPMSLMFFLCLD